MPISREEVWLRDHLEDSLGTGRVMNEELLEHKDVLHIENVLYDHCDSTAKKLIQDYLKPTPFKERGMYL